MEVFASLLYLVLDDSKNYGKWLHSAFPDITDSTRKIFINLIENPDKAIDYLNEKRGVAKIIPRINNIPVFNRSLGFQIASTLHDNEAITMQKLIQTIFAAPFCFRENAQGRYSKYLREFLLIPSDVDIPLTPIEKYITVITTINTNLHLPKIDQKFCQTIHTIRNSEAGKKLRNVMRNVGEDKNFRELESSWKCIADEFSREYYNNEPIEIKNILCSLGETVASATIALSVDFSLHKINNDIFSDIISQLLLSLFGQGTVIGGKLVLKTLQRDLKTQKLREHIENALTVRCSETSIPQALIGY